MLLNKIAYSANQSRPKRNSSITEISCRSCAEKPMQKSRRSILQSLALAVTSLPVSQNLLAQDKFTNNPFALGVASGSATSDSVVLWTRLVDFGVSRSDIGNKIIPVEWQLSKSADFKVVTKVGIAYALPELAYSVHVEISELEENTRFFYRFTAGSFSSVIGKTRTFFSSQNDVNQQLKIGVASCQNFEHGYFSSYSHLINDDPDLILFLGDYIYEYAPGSSGVRSHVGGWCLSLTDYRNRYAQYRQDENLQAAHAYCPWLVIWDDHEVQNDYAGERQGTVGPTSDFLARRAAAYQAFYEHMPLRASALTGGIVGLETGSEVRIYENYKFGSLLSISMLDTRQYRSPQVCNSGNHAGSSIVEIAACKQLQDNQRTMLGGVQEEWLAREIVNASKYVWNIIAQTTLFGSRRFFYPDASVRIWNDSWDGYPAARRRLTDQLVREGTPNPVILGGDLHGYYLGYVLNDYERADGKRIGIEIVTTSISSNDSYKLSPAFLKRNPHLIVADGTRRGYVLLELSSKEMRISLRAISDHRTRESEIETIADFSIVAGIIKIQS